MAETFKSAMRVVRGPAVPLAFAEVAQVWRVGRRRYFSKQSVVRAMAREWIKQRCDCEGDEAEYDANGMTYPGHFSPCKYHDPLRLPALMKRLTALAAKELRGSASRRRSPSHD